jgi:hypothetical protein
MLPSLILRWAITGSIRESVVDVPPLLLGGFPIKALTAALRRCSSSISWLRLRRMYKKPPPIADAMTTTPTTTPAAMPATLGPELSLSGSLVGDSVTTTVSWGFDSVSVALGESEELVDFGGEASFLTDRVTPVW